VYPVAPHYPQDEFKDSQSENSVRIYDQVARSSNCEPQTSARSTNYDQHEKPTRVSLICVNYSILIGSIGRNTT